MGLVGAVQQAWQYAMFSSYASIVANPNALPFAPAALALQKARKRVYGTFGTRVHRQK